MIRKYDDITCHDSLCEHGGKCANDSDNPNCVCPSAYSGRWCEHASKSKWVSAKWTDKLGLTKSRLIVSSLAVLGVILICLVVCCVQCIKKRNKAKKTKRDKVFKNRNVNNVTTDVSLNSSLEEEKSLLSPHAAPQTEGGLGATSAGFQSAPALAFQNY